MSDLFVMLLIACIPAAYWLGYSDAEDDREFEEVMNE